MVGGEPQRDGLQVPRQILGQWSTTAGGEEAIVGAGAAEGGATMAVEGRVLQVRAPPPMTARWALLELAVPPMAAEQVSVMSRMARYPTSLAVVQVPSVATSEATATTSTSAMVSRMATTMAQKKWLFLLRK
jgi:hypothetical protein